MRNVGSESVARRPRVTRMIVTSLAALGLLNWGDEPLAQDACQAPSWINDTDVPVCPTSGSTILPETAPAAAIVVSKLSGWSMDPRTEKPRFGNEPLHRFVLDALQASRKKVPKIFLNGTDESDVTAIREQIDQHCADPKNHCRTQAAQWKAALVRIPGYGFQWQQDYFQTTFDPSTGLPVIRAVRSYVNGLNGETAAAELATAAKSYCISSGDTIPPSTEQNYSFSNAAMGGNIEALPGGLCLHGNNQDWQTFGRYYCGDHNNSVEIDVKWLSVGHVDEVVGLVPDGKSQAPCDFAITWASPQKAFELMKDPKNRDQPFFEFFSDTTFAEQLNSFAARELCARVSTFRETLGNPGRSTPRNSTPDRKARKAGSAASLPSWLMKMIIPEVHAGASLIPSSSGPQVRTRGGCENIPPPTNAEVAAVLERAGYNTLIQQKMEANLAILQKKLKDRTGCPKIKFIPVPNLFFGAEPKDQPPDATVILDGRQRKFGDLSDEERERLPVAQRYAGVPEDRALGLLPNPTNAVLLDRTVIGPKPWNQAFRTYLSDSYGSLGLTFKEADTWHANKSQGNLHCATNTMRVCRPASAAKVRN
jgi:hypothetical protein